MTEHNPRLSRYKKGEPVRNEDRPKVELDDETKKALLKKIESRTQTQLYSVTMGLPSRVRHYVRRFRKMQSQGIQDMKVAEELSPLAKKILDDRLDVAMMVPARIHYDKTKGHQLDLTDEQLSKMTFAAAECDALLTIAAYYFLPGITVAHSATASELQRHPVLRTQVSGIMDVVEYGLLSKAQRSSRQAVAKDLLRNGGWAPLDLE